MDRTGFAARAALSLGLSFLLFTGSSVAQTGGPPPHPLAAAAPADDGQGTMPRKNFANTRYSELDEINTGNVKDLKVAPGRVRSSA